MRRLERWLHQHMFKVGWLLTKNLQTTTILYYTFFLPGVFLHEFIYWLVAGIVNVRAERAIAWPEAQAIAELKLTFIKLARNTNQIKVAIISIAPLIGGLAVIWLITNNILNLNGAISAMSEGDFNAALSRILATPDIWIWVYFMFSVANTMMPDRQGLRGWRPVLLVAGVVIALLYIMGVAQQMLLENLAKPMTEGLNAIALILGVIIVIDLLVTGVLGLIESIIERITGDSATFQNNKLVAMTREELLRQRDQQRAKEERQRQVAKTRAPAGPPSIYKLPLPIPGAPDKELSEPIIISRDDKVVLPAGPKPPVRVQPSVIPGTAISRPEDESKGDEKPLQEAKIETPLIITRPQVEDEEDEEDVDEEDDEFDEDEDADDTEDEEEEEERA